MFVGHGLLAVGIIAWVGHRRGWARERTLRLAALAGLFATLPDVDVLYAATGLLGATGSVIPVESFWDAGNQFHRGATHSLLVGSATALAAGLVALGLNGGSSNSQRSRQWWSRLPLPAGLAVLVGVVTVTIATSGPLNALIVALFTAGAAGLAAVGARFDLSARAVGGVALLGLVSHPLGDLVTGSPPVLLYPFDATIVAERITLSSDPTLHLLGAFAIELAVVWFAVVTLLVLYGRSPWSHVDYRAVAGLGYGAAALAIPAPTLDVSYQFVFSVLAVGMVGVAPATLRGRRWQPTLALEQPRPACAVVTALASITLATSAYGVAYLVVG